MNLNKEFLSEVISYLINRGVTLTDVLDTFNEHFNTLDAFNDSLKNIPTEIKRGTINNVIEESVLPKYTLTESDKVKLESVSLSPETLNKVFDTSKEHEKQCKVRKPLTDIDLMLCGREIEKQGFNVEPEPEQKENPAPLNVSLSPNTRDYPTSIIPRGKGVSKARKMLFEVVEGKTVLEHLKANNIDYKLFDTRIRKNWSMEKACTTPLTKVVKPYTRAKKSTETPKQDPVIIPDTDVKCLEPEKITGTKKRMMLVNGKMTEIEVSDTDLVQSSIEKPEETLETKTETLETESNTEKATESVTIEPQAESDTDTGENNADAYSDAICEELHETDADKIEKIADQAVRDIVTGKNKEKKKAEPKKDYAVSDLCFKLNVTTHELREMVNSGEFPQPDRGNKWSAKLLKGKI